MDILIRRATIIDPSSPFHRQSKNILIQKGFISAITDDAPSADETVNIDGLCVSPGWVDIFSNFCDPGFEYRETLATGAAAAASGGFTDVFLIPNTAPVVHTKGAVEYLVSRGRDLPVTIHPIGAVTKNAEGKELAEMYDMHQSGAQAFGDGINPVQSSGILLKALQYLKAIDKVLIQLPEDRAVSASGLMNEGIISTRLGLPGKPAIAEELQLARDIELAKYADAKIHFTAISTARSVELIRHAKKQGLNITCSVTPHHLYFTDEDLSTYDTNLKLNPPIRTRSDRDALREAVKDGTVDCIASHHLPQDKDHKMTEFEYAADGIAGLETSFAALVTAMPDLSLERLVELFSSNARRLFQMEQPLVRENERAALTLFLPAATWTPARLRSKSGNAPYLDKTLTGRPLGIIAKDKLFLNQ